ncbi:MAG: hypothetical protein OXI01_24160 [Albidovulum sp.]|nr:hypothetical protein [Albidovulum sp.]
MLALMQWSRENSVEIGLLTVTGAATAILWPKLSPHQKSQVMQFYISRLHRLFENGKGFGY